MYPPCGKISLLKQGLGFPSKNEDTLQKKGILHVAEYSSKYKENLQKMRYPTCGRISLLQQRYIPNRVASYK